MKFRIKIETQRDGKKYYQAQVKKNFFIGWENIINEDDYYYRSSLISQSYSNEASCINNISMYQKTQNRIYNSKIIKTEFKPVTA